MNINIIEAIEDENLLRPFLGDDLDSWRRWLLVLKITYGLGIEKRYHKLIKKCTGRDARRLPSEGFSKALFLTGRRSGKSRNAALVGAFEACLAGHEAKLSRGETGLVAICAPSRAQAKIVKSYLRAIFQLPSILANEVATETQDGFELRNGNRISVLAGDFRTVRGYTLIAAICDEICYMGAEADSHIKSDTELIRAISPGLSTTNGKLICISSPHGRRGYAYQTWKKNFGNDKGKTLVWNCSSRTMNLTLSQSIIDDAMIEDPAAARSEYLGLWRDDVADYLPLSVIEAAVVKHRLMLSPNPRERYFAFADLAGGRSDSAAIAIAHKEEDGRSILDYIEVYKAPFDPHNVIALMCKLIERYKAYKTIGDNYAADFVAKGFSRNGVRYRLCKQNKSALYSEFLPYLCSQRVELLDHPLMVKQLSSLERRTRSGGRDIIDHPHGGHDDVANVVAGVVYELNRKKIKVCRAL